MLFRSRVQAAKQCPAQQHGGAERKLQQPEHLVGAGRGVRIVKVAKPNQDMRFDVPVIGVAKADWNLDQLKARAKDSVEKHGGLDRVAFAKLSGLLRYVDGDYKDPATFQALRKELKDAQRPAHYLAIPPVLFGAVVEQLVKSGCAKASRVVVEKPFGRSLATAQALNTSNLGPIKLVAATDVHEDRMDSALKNFEAKFGERAQVSKENRFLGFDAYKKAIAQASAQAQARDQRAKVFTERSPVRLIGSSGARCARGSARPGAWAHTSGNMATLVA